MPLPCRGSFRHPKFHFFLKSWGSFVPLPCRGSSCSSKNASFIKHPVLLCAVALQGHCFSTENAPCIKNPVRGCSVALQGHLFSPKKVPFIKEIRCEVARLPCRGSFFHPKMSPLYKYMRFFIYLIHKYYILIPNLIPMPPGLGDDDGTPRRISCPGQPPSHHAQG